MTLNRLAALTLVLTGIVIPSVVGWLDASYSAHASYLSELGAVGAPFRSVVNYAGFLPVGLVICLLVWRLWPHLSANGARLGLCSLLGIAVGYIGAFAFSCDAGCPASGSTRQGLHNLAGLIEYVGAFGGFTLIAISCRTVHPRFAALTFVTLLTVASGFILMTQPAFAEQRGLFQRLADFTIFAWFSISILWLPARRVAP